MALFFVDMPLHFDLEITINLHKALRGLVGQHVELPVLVQNLDLDCFSVLILA